MKLGVNITLTPANAAADVAAAAALGAKVVRTSQEQGWGEISTLLGPYRKACDDHGIQLFETVQAKGHVQPRSQRDLDAYGQLCAEAAAIADWTSTGNEINGFGSNELPDPKAAAACWTACVEARDKLAPHRWLYTPSMEPGGEPIGKTPVEPLTFLQAMLIRAQPTLSRPHIGVDWHGYDDGRHDPAGHDFWNQCWRTRAVQAWLASVGEPELPIAWSEWGTATGPSGNVQAISPAMQVQRFTEQLHEAHQQTKAGVHHGPVIWYQLRDRTPSNDRDWTACCGLLDVHGARNPVGTAFALVAAA